MSNNINRAHNITKKPWGYRWTILLIIWVLYIINYFDRISVLIFLPYIQRDLNLTPVEVGWLGSIFFFGYAIAQLSSGFFADKIGPKKTMNIAIWVFTAVTFLTGFVKSLWQFIILRLALALGEGHHYVPAVRTIANWFPRHEKGRANGYFTTTWAIGPAIIPIIVTWLSADVFEGAWRPVFFVLAIPGFMGVFLLYRYMADYPGQMLQKGKMTQEEYDLITSSVGEEMDARKKTYSTKIFTTDIQYYLFTFNFFILLMIYWGMTTWISTFLVKQHGMEIKTMGFFAAIPYIVAGFAMWLGGFFADKVFRGRMKVVTMIGFLGCIPVLFFIGRVPKGEPGLLLLGLALGGFFINFPWGVMQAFPSMRYPKEVVGRAMGFTNGIGQFGSFISPLIAGYLVVTLLDGSYDFSNVFLFWSVLALLAVISTCFLKETPIDCSKYEAES
ncbi:MAG: MFS transporter [Deltaproteobacteria bacterium]|nr:MFS transporter [Deltaproteobacteria bacterium]